MNSQSINPNEYAYLWSPTRQILDKNGKPLVSGYVQLNQHGTPGIYAESYSDWNGSLNARNILLDGLGRATAIVENDKLYDMYVYNRYNVLEYSALGVNCSGEGGESSMRFTSSDGSIVITRLNNSVDFKVHSEEASYGTGTGSSVDSQGMIKFDNVEGNITLITADTLSLAASKVYHATLQLELSTKTITDSYIDATVNDSENGVHKFQIDGSKTHQYIDISWDLYATKSYARFYANLPESVSVTAATLYIHAVNSLTVSGGGDLPPSTPADEGKVLTVDAEGIPEWSSKYNNIKSVKVLNSTVGIDAIDKDLSGYTSRWFGYENIGYSTENKYTLIDTMLNINVRIYTDPIANIVSKNFTVVVYAYYPDFDTDEPPIVLLGKFDLNKNRDDPWSINSIYSCNGCLTVEGSKLKAFIPEIESHYNNTGTNIGVFVRANEYPYDFQFKYDVTITAIS